MKKVIFDTDPGLDDARALALLLENREMIEVVAITVCMGNVGVEQCAKNVFRILSSWNRLDIPVFKGSNNTFDNRQHGGTKYF